MERISIHDGKTNNIFVVPNFECKNCDIIAKAAAQYLNASYIINNSWKDGPAYDYDTETCNCANLNHLVDVPYDEFLDPLKRFVIRAKNKSKNQEARIYYIFGLENDVKRLTNDKDTGMIIGYGLGDPDSLTCERWMVKGLIHLMDMDNDVSAMSIYGGKTIFTGWHKNSINQLYRKNGRDMNVMSMQLGILMDNRTSEASADLFGEYLGSKIDVLDNTRVPAGTTVWTV